MKMVGLERVQIVSLILVHSQNPKVSLLAFILQSLMATSDGLVFALVANAQGILAESGDASFQPLAKKILEKLALDVDMKKNYNHSR